MFKIPLRKEQRPVISQVGAIRFGLFLILLSISVISLVMITRRFVHNKATLNILDKF